MFASKTDGIPVVNDFAKAQRTFEGIKPVRGWEPHVRPLRMRREKHKLIVQYPDAYAARLYNTDMVTWHEDGRVSITRDDHQMSAEFVYAVTPAGVGAVMHKGSLWFRVQEGERGTRFYQCEPNRQLHFARSDQSLHYWTLLNPEDCVTHTTKRVNRTLSKPVREKLAPLTKWMKACEVVANGDIGPIVSELPFIHRNEWTDLLAQYLDSDLPAEDWPLLMRHLAAYRPTFNQGSMGRALRLAGNWQDLLLRAAYIRADVFDRVDVPLGQLPPDVRW